MKFLLIDDNPTDRELLVQHLRREFPSAEFVEASAARRLMRPSLRATSMSC
jgi:CheY-like chemotaxis protein